MAELNRGIIDQDREVRQHLVGHLNNFGFYLSEAESLEREEGFT